MTREENINKAYEYAYQIRKMALDMARHAGKAGSHIGGGFSCIEIMATLYGAVMNITGYNGHCHRDRFIPSKAHCTMAYYPAVSCAGMISREDVETYYDNGGALAGKPLDIENGLDYSGGSLGMGLSVGLGMALHATRKREPYKTFVLLGDGESDEGEVWEAIMAAGHFKQENLIVIVDYNNMQFDGANTEIMNLADLKKKFEAFEWKSIEVNGHSIEELFDALTGEHNGQPLAIIAHTVKAHGIPSLENQVQSHHAVLTQEDYDFVMKELESGKYGRR